MMTLLIEQNNDLISSIAELIGAVAWPTTLLAVLYIFRNGFAQALKRMGSFKADTSGFSIDFNEQIDAAKELFEDLKETATAKSGGQIQPLKPRTPYAQLVNLKSEIANDLDRLARSAGMDKGPGGINNRLDQLVGSGHMEYAKAEMVRTLVGVIASANREVTQAQVDRIEAMFKDLNL
jgi:hypothetical protein